VDSEVETVESYPDDAPLEIIIYWDYSSQVLNADSLYTILQFLRNTPLHSYSGSHKWYCGKQPRVIYLRRSAWTCARGEPIAMISPGDNEKAAAFLSDETCFLKLTFQPRPS